MPAPIRSIRSRRAWNSAQVTSILPGPYDFPEYRCRTYAAATNKCPILPYRGVARTGVCLALELVLDAIAREAGIEPHEVRRRNLVRPEQMPFDNITNKHFDSGDYPECLRRAVAAIDVEAVRRRQAQAEPDGRLIGVGMAIYCEQGAHGTSVYSGWGIPMVPGFEQATARLTPDGGLELRVGVHSHGQGLETTLAQVAHEILGIDTAKIKVVLGDTEYTPYSTGTWGSRCMVMAGGAVGEACKEIASRAARIGARLLQTEAANVTVRDGQAIAAHGAISLADIARTWYLRPQDLPSDVYSGGLDATVGYKPLRDTGTFSYAAHAAIVAVDPEMGDVEILDYVIVEDGGTLVNPMIVDGQILGGYAQGIGTALYEEMPFDAPASRWPRRFPIIMLPGPTEVPAARLDHMETPSPYTHFGVKGIGEGGAIAPPAAITNAINDALKSLGAELLVSPVTPRRVLQAIRSAQEKRRMKPAAFDYERPNDIAGALALAARSDIAVRFLAGGQSLGPMLNLRLAQPDLLIDLTGIAELKHVEETADALEIGACVTHADIEDGRLPMSPTARWRRWRMASPIAPCAIAAPSAAASRTPIRPRIGSCSWRRLAPRLWFAGRPGGAMCRPAISWSAFSRPRWRRTNCCRRSAFRARRAMRAGATTRPAARPANSPMPAARCCIDPARGVCRAVIGAVEPRPIVLDDARTVGCGGAAVAPDVAHQALEAAGIADPIDRQMHVVALRRAVEQAAAR